MQRDPDETPRCYHCGLYAPEHSARCWGQVEDLQRRVKALEEAIEKASPEGEA
jgi:hypothetical protein